MNQAFTGNGNGNGQLRAAKKAAPPPVVASASGDKESYVTLTTADGVKLQGALSRVTRHIAVFELYNPAVTPRFSEVLGEFTIVMQSRAVYSGRAVVSKVLDAGTKVACEVILNATEWADVSSELLARRGGQIAEEFQQFLRQWQKFYKVLPEYKIALTDMQTFLTDLAGWLEQVEVGIRNAPPRDRPALEQETAQQLEGKVVPVIWSFFERFENISSRIDPDLIPAHHTFGKRLLHPLLLNSPFVARTFHKPSGYAGDYEMVSMMFRQPFEGASLFAKTINLYALQLPPIVAHRNRIKYLAKQIDLETMRATRTGHVARIFNFACGPAIEVQRFLAESPMSERAAFMLVDFDTEALGHAERAINHIIKRWELETQVQFKRQSVQQLIKESQRAATIKIKEKPEYDFVYCAGLFDYLPDNTCRLLMDIFYQLLAPGGLLVATNVDEHAARHEMECFLEWYLVQRNTDQMRAIAPRAATPDDISLKRDSTGVNLFMEVRKPAREK